MILQNNAISLMNLPCFLFFLCLQVYFVLVFLFWLQVFMLVVILKKASFILVVGKVFSHDKFPYLVLFLVYIS